VGQQRLLPYLWMLCGSAAFALMGGLAHALAPRCDWQVIALARSLLPLLLAAALVRRAGARFVFFRPRTLWVRSCAGSISLVSTFYALTRLPVSDVLTLTNMFPLWVALLSWPLLRERPAGRVWLAVACGLAGVALIQRPHFAEGNFVTLIALVSSVSTAVALLGLHRLQGIDARAIVVHFSAVAFLFVAASFFLFERRLPLTAALDGTTLAMLAGVGVAATLGQLFLTKAFAAGPPAKVAIVGLTQIVFAMVLDVLLFGRSFGPATILGISLVVAPTAWLLASWA
jgi:drug/metabolite transporter (DMT)-like permease